ncbi:MAG: TatD family hydrolase [Bacilli bacterium]
MFDTHCHLDENDYENIDLVIKKMKNDFIIASGYDTKSNKNVINLISKYPNIYGTIGIHPSEIKNVKEEDFLYLEENINNPKIVGIGEIGLDYHWDKDNKDEQKEVFIRQIKLAQKYSKPIVIHSRDAIEETYEILVQYLKNTKASLHCYSGSYDMALKFKKLGIKFGIGGVLTFKNSQKLKEIVTKLELTDFLTETDSPYLSPEPFRGKTNEPFNVHIVANNIAKLKNCKVEEVEKITTKNATELFNIKL